ncbi:DNA methyltransferase [Dyella sp. 20L07]|uniref:DNA methyltransferase n=1 Tax=Dyella sp. 20L07 TaxID=3384240 RepID=UPI003D2C01DD
MGEQPIAPLRVETDGAHFGVDGAAPWDEQRDARRYTGPHRVVAHPPCQRQGRYWRGAPNRPNQHRLGEFASALTAVRNCGGVIEHPADSKAWAFFGLQTPSKSGSWIRADTLDGWTCHVEQGHHGHISRKSTRLYAVGTDLPELKWGSSGQRIRPVALARYGYEKARRIGVMAMIGGKDKTRLRNATPHQFRDRLIPIARSAPAKLLKPTELMRYLCRLVTPAGGTVLDPFMGSGSTGRGALLEGFDFIGIEQDADYAQVARARIGAVQLRLPLGDVA